MALKFGLVGCGGMGLRHAYGYVELQRHSPALHLAAVCDVHEESARYVADEVEKATHTRPAVFSSLNEMLEQENELAAVDIVTDTRMHHAFAIQAMEAGIHVLTEKPMGLTMRACRIMRETANRTGTILSVGEQYRRDPMNRLAHALIQSGVIGEPCFATKVLIGGGATLMHNTGWRALKSRAGSIILEQGVHEADLLLYFLGDIRSIYAQTGLFSEIRKRGPVNPNLARFYAHRVEDQFADVEEVVTDQEDTSFGVLRFESGAIGQLTITNASKAYSTGLNAIHGSLGTVVLPPSRSGRVPLVHVEGRDDALSAEELLDSIPNWELDDLTARFFGGCRRITGYEKPFDKIDRTLIALELEELAQAIIHGWAVEVGPDEGMKALAVAYGMLESGSLGAPVTITELMDGTIAGYQQEIDREAGITE